MSLTEKDRAELEKFSDPFDNIKYNLMAVELEEREYDFHDTGKSLPYIGWYWRDTNLEENSVSIGKTDTGLVGVMENNKWSYPERRMTESECSKFKELLIKAHGSEKLADAKDMWDWFQGLEVIDG